MTYRCHWCGRTKVGDRLPDGWVRVRPGVLNDGVSEQCWTALVAYGLALSEPERPKHIVDDEG